MERIDHTVNGYELVSFINWNACLSMYNTDFPMGVNFKKDELYGGHPRCP